MIRAPRPPQRRSRNRTEDPRRGAGTRCRRRPNMPRAALDALLQQLQDIADARDRLNLVGQVLVVQRAP